MSEYTGKIIDVSTKGTHGYIKPDPKEPSTYPSGFDQEEHVYFLVSDAYADVKAGDRVTYSLDKLNLGYQAKGIKMA